MGRFPSSMVKGLSTTAGGAARTFLSGIAHYSPLSWLASAEKYYSEESYILR